jgi:hypothetical protein
MYVRINERIFSFAHIFTIARAVHGYASCCRRRSLAPGARPASRGALLAQRGRGLSQIAQHVRRG